MIYHNIYVHHHSYEVTRETTFLDLFTDELARIARARSLSLPPPLPPSLSLSLSLSLSR